MKINEYIKSTRLAMTTLALAFLSAHSDGALVGNKSEGIATPPRLVEMEIELPAANSSTPTVTVWVPETCTSIRKTDTVKSQGKEISLPASNSSVTSMTVWDGKR